LGTFLVDAEGTLGFLQRLHELGMGALMAESALFLVTERLDAQPQGVKGASVGIGGGRQRFSSQPGKVGKSLAEEPVHDPSGMGRHGGMGMLPDEPPGVAIDVFRIQSGLSFLDQLTNPTAVGFGSAALFQVLQKDVQGAELTETRHSLGQQSGRGGIADQLVKGLEPPKMNAQPM
jgi:hypothetical protein